jgi:hypothetical protein
MLFGPQKEFTFRAAPAQEPRQAIRNPIVLTLLWASKTDSRLAAVCTRWAIATQCALGVFVGFTALLAFGAAYYTLSTLHVASSTAMWIAILYAVFIGALDREIVGGLDKATAIVRPILSLFIGTIIAIPIELWVFQSRIDQDLKRQYRSENQAQFDELRTAQNKLDQSHAGLEAQLVELRRQEHDWGKAMDDELVGRQKADRSGVPGAGPVFENAKRQQADVRQRIEEVRRDLRDAERALPAERQRFEEAFQRQEINLVSDFVTRYEALHRVIHSSDPLYRLSWLITLTLILIEMTPALLKVLTPHADYHHLARAEIRENVTRIDEISDRNYRMAIQNPEAPEPSVSEKFTAVRFGREAGQRFGRQR